MAPNDLTVPRAEIHALLLRAARGAGLPLGHGEDLARAVSAFGSEKAVSAAARAIGKSWQGARYDLSGNSVRFKRARALECLPVAIDALQSDVDRAELDRIDEPDLIEPYLAQAAQEGRAKISVRAAGDTHVLEHASRGPRPDRLKRLTLASPVLSVLKEFAARTYVPATTASRAGAGAGRIDND